ncbi:MAG: glycosyltransferase family 2 protein [Planctomycetes bacterium]|nr:glycosyltransferase family 2 protein [Planctomycetota bacterium]
MTRPVSVVIPSLDDLDLFERHLPALLAELERRAARDEVLVVDDTGRDLLAAALRARWPAVRVLAMPRNRGFARAMTAGIEAARHELVFAMNPDVLVRRGFLDPLVACISEEDVWAVVPRILLGGDEQKVESWAFLRERNGVLELDQPSLRSTADARALRLAPVAFAVGGACLYRRADFLATGFDPLYEPFYWEDIDWSWVGWRNGKRILYQPAAVVEHQHRGTIGRRVPKDFVRAMVERNRLLFNWKHIDAPELQRRHLAALYRQALDAYLEDRREDLLWLSFALERLQAALAARAELPVARRNVLEILRASRPPE